MVCAQMACVLWQRIEYYYYHLVSDLLYRMDVNLSHLPELKDILRLSNYYWRRNKYTLATLHCSSFNFQMTIIIILIFLGKLLVFLLLEK